MNLNTNIHIEAYHASVPKKFISHHIESHIIYLDWRLGLIWSSEMLSKNLYLSFIYARGYTIGPKSSTERSEHLVYIWDGFDTCMTHAYTCIQCMSCLECLCFILLFKTCISHGHAPTISLHLFHNRSLLWKICKNTHLV